jgi:hypothetical protein
MDDPRQSLGPVLSEAVEQIVSEVVAAAIADLPRDESWPAYMDTPTAARYLGISQERVWKLKATGKLDYCQEAPNCRVTFPREACDRLMATWLVKATT